MHFFFSPACCVSRENQIEGGGAVAGSGIEVLGSEHYGVPEEDERDFHTGGSLDAGVESAAGDGENGAPSTLGSPEILIRPPHYGFNFKVTQIPSVVPRLNC